MNTTLSDNNKFIKIFDIVEEKVNNNLLFKGFSFALNEKSFILKAFTLKCFVFLDEILLSKIDIFYI